MSRKPDPLSPYRVRLHVDKGYRYASTQPGAVNPETGKREYTRVHWGTVDKNLRFHPNSTYILASGEERSKLIFPEDWDLSETSTFGVENTENNEEFLDNCVYSVAPQRG